MRQLRRSNGFRWIATMLLVTRGGKKRSRKLLAQDKGYDGEIDSFLAASSGRGPLPISIDSIAFTTRTTFAIVESLREGRAIPVMPSS